MRTVEMMVNIPENLREKDLVQGINVGFYLLARGHFPEDGEICLEKGKTTRFELTPKGEDFYRTIKGKFGSKREAFIAALVVLKKRPPNFRCCDMR